LHCIEARRAFPKELRALIAVLILKLKGLKASHRALGIFPGLYRLWARLRRCLLQAWEVENQLPCLAWQKGSSCVEVVYRQSLLAEGHRGEGLITAAFLWDLSDFYEHISREKLKENATALGMPGLLITIAVNQYQGSRVLCMGQLAMRARPARRGIPAGCAFATYFVQAYTARQYDSFQRQHPETPLSVFIDDLTVQIHDVSSERVVFKAAQAADDLLTLVQEELECSVSKPKAALVCSDKDTLIKLRRSFGTFAGPCSRVASNLGIDFSAGTKRRRMKRGSQWLKRSQIARARGKRLMRL
jgi:hypothetical protein